MDKVITASGTDWLVEPTTAQLGEVVHTINKLMYTKRFDELNDTLRDLNVAEMHLAYIIAYARCPCTVGSKLSEWKPFIKRAKEELNSRQLNGAHLMRGLL